MTPHQRRMRELEASRWLQCDLQALINSHPGTVPIGGGRGGVRALRVPAPPGVGLGASTRGACPKV